MKRDEDNVLFGACKIILDALQQTNILPNDNRRWVRLDLLPVRVDRQKPRIEVTLKESTEEDGGEHPKNEMEAKEEWKLAKIITS